MTGMRSGSAGPGSPLIVSAFHQALITQGALILVVLLLLALAWSVMRHLRSRRGQGAGDGRALPPAPPEPAARRVLRIGFGLIWIFDGLLQLQPDMPASMATQVLRPAAAGSPGWVRQLVDFGAETWTLHPTAAAAAVVWIQLGIGAFLLVAPRGRWSRAAGGVSTGWALVVWVFGEAFGGVFAPGVTVLFGAPGAALFYAAAGGLVALPDRAWAGRTAGRLATGSIGALLVGMAVVQAWPGRGWWTGGRTGRPGPLAGMVAQMSTTPQPHPLASALSAFSSFDLTHGWGVNLFVVVALATVGAALLSGRDPLLVPALVALAVLGLAIWVLVQDLGFWGGVGTDPNSMIPMLVVAAAGYLALARAPATDEGDAPAAAADHVVGESWWTRVDPAYAGRLAVSGGAVFALLVGSVTMASATVNRQADPVVTEAADGLPAVVSGPAPPFRLVDQYDRPVSLTSLRGFTVALTFLDPVCTSDCPLIAQEFKITDHLLGRSAARVKFVAIAANPLYHSVGVLDAFDRQEGLVSQPNWLYLTGSTAELQRVLRAYQVGVFVVPAGAMVEHADTAYVIDARGDARRILDDDPGSGSADASSFSVLLASEITQVMQP